MNVPKKFQTPIKHQSTCYMFYSYFTVRKKPRNVVTSIVVAAPRREKGSSPRRLELQSGSDRPSSSLTRIQSYEWRESR